MGSPTIFKGDFVKQLKDSIEFLSNQTIITGVATDPSSSATSAPAGSILINTSGNMYIKQDAGSSTNWDLISTASTPTGLTDCGVTVVTAESATPGSSLFNFSSNTWEDMPLTDQYGDTSFCTLDAANNEVDLIAGTYAVDGFIQTWNDASGNSTQTRFQNITDGSTACLGMMTSPAASISHTHSITTPLLGVFDITASKSFSFQAISEGGTAASMDEQWHGTSKSGGQDDVYLQVRIQKLR